VYSLRLEKSKMKKTEYEQFSDRYEKEDARQSQLRPVAITIHRTEKDSEE
jgi:hypothetical protein